MERVPAELGGQSAFPRSADSVWHQKKKKTLAVRWGRHRQTKHFHITSVLHWYKFLSLYRKYQQIKKFMTQGGINTPIHCRTEGRHNSQMQKPSSQDKMIKKK